MNSAKASRSAAFAAVLSLGIGSFAMAQQSPQAAPSTSLKAPTSHTTTHHKATTHHKSVHKASATHHSKTKHKKASHNPANTAGDMTAKP
jgi:hypothetical protein